MADIDALLVSRVWRTRKTPGVKLEISCLPGADSDALLSYEGLANMQDFWGKPDKARALYKEGQAKHGGTSRFYRSWAQSEKKQGHLEVSTWCFNT